MWIDSSVQPNGRRVITTATAISEPWINDSPRSSTHGYIPNRHRHSYWRINDTTQPGHYCCLPAPPMQPLTCSLPLCHVHAHFYAHAYAHVYTHAQAHFCTHIYAHVYTHVHVHFWHTCLHTCRCTCPNARCTRLALLCRRPNLPPSTTKASLL